ncbi:hypothetical protein EI94DRAFT_1802627 [Lactarius quietus]|nr:hypothetical protein EI94DRAFT_1802627 [Lactarius quietus]
MGYQRFFIQEREAPWAIWLSLQTHTSLPYTLTFKSNGCIFIAELFPSEILSPTSRGTMRPLQGVSEGHAQFSESWLHQLDLRSFLFVKRRTLCDDNFGQHVLLYHSAQDAANKSCLHLHWINVYTRKFRMQPTATLEAFAREWGLIPNTSLEHNFPLRDIEAFTDGAGRSGTWNGEAPACFVAQDYLLVVHLRLLVIFQSQVRRAVH